MGRKRKIIPILEEHIPSTDEVQKYLGRWQSQRNEDYEAQENALDKLFIDLIPHNTEITDILIKSSVLNDFYSTNIYKVYYVAQHYLMCDIDSRLAKRDLSLVNDLTNVTINGEKHHFYSFASKYCSHHCPDIYPIYDSYVHKVLKYYSDRDCFYVFQDNELKDYATFKKVILSFQKHYGLEDFSIKEIDKYLWQLGKEVYSSISKHKTKIS